MTYPVSEAGIRKVYSHGKPPAYDTKYGLATDLGEKYHVSHSTIEKYARYSRAIDRLAEVSPSMLPKIMSGEVHIAMDNMVDIAKMTEQEIGAITKAVMDTSPNASYSPR